ncbi:ACP S-malonyltransferase [Pseudoduganella violacea]|uniref:[acyl-carrier-protein] S-malonyltransferase n=1 Tax=Pseudoduganella violacea TaxID=1715466 RepID=A0A7W5BD74_9BURK|nr:ACP S-malonyltransferase [Pseudoduganella violacea]MBB3120969.1 trans-AT polyketide synthase/acyltransferase/oxidoreductase domain-containing protein [Pseudoduganella violacea]
MKLMDARTLDQGAPAASPLPSVWMFSGQGSQYRGMGRQLFQHEPVFRGWLERFDALARQDAGIALIDELYQVAPQQAFERLALTHPAIFAVEYALAQTLFAKGLRPDLLLGASLGDFTAAAVAGVLPADAVIGLLGRHARLVEARCEPGFMLAVFGPASLHQELPALRRYSDLVGVNYDAHFVVAGHARELPHVEQALRAAGVQAFRLPVGFGFHSRNVAPVAAAWSELLAGAPPSSAPAIPWVSCATGGLVGAMGGGFFANVAQAPIQFAEALAFTRGLLGGAACWIDLGPSGTLANFAGKLLAAGHTVLPAMSQFGNERALLERILQSVPPRAAASTSNQTGTTTMKAYLFPGQGAQSTGMGAELFDRYPDYVARADRVLGYSVRALCLDNPDNRLGRTDYTQPALYVVNALAYLAAVEQGGEPQYLAGHSLGEYSALFAAGVLSFETGLQIVMRRGALMAASRDGAMAAVIGLEEAAVRQIILQAGLANIDIANLNAPTQIVISGPVADIVDAQAVFEKNGCFTYVRLPVSGAFHSRLMAEASQEFARFLDQFTFAAPRIPVLSNVTAQPHRPENIRAMMVEQMVGSVRWTDSIRYLAAQGVADFVEVGPGKVLAQLLKKILPAGAAPAPIPVPIPVSAPVPVSVPAPVIAPAPLPAPPAPYAPAGAAAAPAAIGIDALGCPEFRADYGLRYAYVGGAMVHGIASTALVAALARGGMLGYFGTGGLPLERIEEAILTLQRTLTPQQPYGMNLLHGALEEKTVDLYLAHGVCNIEAAAFMQITPALARFRLRGLRRQPDGTLVRGHRVLAKVSRPEVAAAFLAPVPAALVAELLRQGKISEEQAALAQRVPVADDICVESDSGGHTDMGVMTTLLPTIQLQRDQAARQFGYAKKIRIGAAGGIGTPPAAAAAFMLGADFILTGSINQCSVESGASDMVKDLLQELNVQDTDYAPAGDMFEMGAKVQVMRRGLFFPARANKLYELYKYYDSLDDLPAKVRQQLEDKYFGRSFESIFDECRRYYPAADIALAEQQPKQKMAYVFRWYFGHATRAALRGDAEQKVNFQVQCGPALGAFNQWVKGGAMEHWRQRHVDQMALAILRGACDVLNTRYRALLGAG